MNCRITIDNGKEDGGVVSEGKLTTYENAFVLEYVIDGDPCKLSFSAGRAVQERRGSISLRLSFEAGCETLCTVGDGDFLGTFPVTTKNLKAEFGETGARLELEYLCAGEDIKLFITAVKI